MIKQIAVFLCSLIFAVNAFAESGVNEVEVRTVYPRVFYNKAWWSYFLAVKERTPLPKKIIVNIDKMETSLDGEYIQVEGRVSKDGHRIDVKPVAYIEGNKGKLKYKKIDGNLMGEDGKDGFIGHPYGGNNMGRGVSEGLKFKIKYKVLK